MNNGEIRAPVTVGPVTPPIDVARPPGVAPEAHVLGEPVGPAIPETGAPHASAVAEARTSAFTAGIAEPMSKIPPDADEALKRAAKGHVEDKAQVSAEAAQQARVNAYTEITGFGIPLDKNSTVDGVMDQIRAQRPDWKNDEPTRAHIAGAIEHAQAQASQPEAQPPSGDSSSAVAAEIGSTDGKPSEAEATTGTSTTSGEGAASSDGRTEDSTAPTSETADATSSYEQPLTPEQQRIAALEKTVENYGKVLKFALERIKQLDGKNTKWWEWIILLLGNVAKPAIFDPMVQSFEAEMGRQAS